MTFEQYKSLIKFKGILFLVPLIFACAVDRVTTEIKPRPELTLPVPIRIQPCVDRTENKNIDLGSQATTIFKQQITATKEFVIQQNGRYILYCDVTKYLTGSALKRWIAPGWGTTVGQISAMLQDSKTGEPLIIIEGNATVSIGGLYTIGAENYIVPTAVKDVVNKLRSWAIEK